MQLSYQITKILECLVIEAAQLVKADTVVIPTTSIPQGIAALFQYDVASTLEENASHMNTALETVKSGSLHLLSEILRLMV